jgi:hypothetical protein
MLSHFANKLSSPLPLTTPATQVSAEELRIIQDQSKEGRGKETSEDCSCGIWVIVKHQSTVGTFLGASAAPLPEGEQSCLRGSGAWINICANSDVEGCALRCAVACAVPRG